MCWNWVYEVEALEVWGRHRNDEKLRDDDEMDELGLGWLAIVGYLWRVRAGVR
jgi:hypothetical protein